MDYVIAVRYSAKLLYPNAAVVIRRWVPHHQILCQHEQIHPLLINGIQKPVFNTRGRFCPDRPFTKVANRNNFTSADKNHLVQI